MRRLALLLLLLPLPARALDVGAFATAPEADSWELVHEEDGVKVFTKAIPGSPVYGLRTDGLIDAPIGKVAQVLFDHARAAEWVERLVEERLIRFEPDGDYLEYNHFRLPFPFTDRDYLTKVHLGVDGAKRTLSLTTHSVEDPAVPTKDNVRGGLQSVYLLESVEGGARTRLQVLYLMDPHGNVPAFVVNFFQKSWPVSTYQGIRKQARRNDLRTPERFRPVVVALGGQP
jgi:hypothetical protein